ncbi:hypothetical protein JCM8202_000499 [Rhodotorula sphaerocarpa]
MPRLSALPHALAVLLLACTASVLAQSSASGSNVPTCATGCFATKITEAGYLAPSISATDLAALCSDEVFAQAYFNCLSDHCTPEQYAQGVALGQAVCANVGGALPSSGITGSATQVFATLSAAPVATGSQGSSAAARFSTFLQDISGVVGSTPVTSAFMLPSSTAAPGSSQSAPNSSSSAAAVQTGDTTSSALAARPTLTLSALSGIALLYGALWTL